MRTDGTLNVCIWRDHCELFVDTLEKVRWNGDVVVDCDVISRLEGNVRLVIERSFCVWLLSLRVQSFFVLCTSGKTN